MIEAEDTRELRCPRLGHEVTFHYCRTLEAHRVCPGILNCWWQQFDVQSFLAEHLAPEAVEAFLEPADGTRKMSSILELIAKAKAAQAKNNS